MSNVERLCGGGAAGRPGEVDRHRVDAVPVTRRGRIARRLTGGGDVLIALTRAAGAGRGLPMADTSDRPKTRTIRRYVRELCPRAAVAHGMRAWARVQWMFDSRWIALAAEAFLQGMNAWDWADDGPGVGGGEVSAARAQSRVPESDHHSHYEAAPSTRTETS